MRQLRNMMFGIITVVSVMAVALAGVVSAAQTVRVGYLHTVAVDSHMWLASSEGYFEDEGLAIEPIQFNTGISLMQALAGGGVDVAIMGAVISNFPSRGVGQVFLLNNLEYGTASIWVQEDSGIDSVSDLAGESVLTTSGTTAHVLLATALDDAGLDPNASVVVNMDMSAAVSAFIAGAAPAVATWAPYDLQIMESRPDAIKLTEAGDYYPEAAIAGGWVASNEFYDENKETLEKIIRVWFRANEALIHNTDESLQTVYDTAYSDIPYSTVVDSFEKELVFDNDEWAEHFRTGQAGEWIGQVEQVFVDIGAFNNFVPVEEFFDPSLYLNAYEDVYGASSN